MYKVTLKPGTYGWTVWISSADGTYLYENCHYVTETWWGAKRKFKKAQKQVDELNKLSGLT